MKSTLLAFAGLAVLMAVFLAFANDHENRRQQLINPPTPTLGPRDRYVRYEVHGEGYAHITVTNQNGATEQYYDHLPYGLELTAPSGQLISVAAQDGGFGEITCQIYLNGAKVNETTSTGKYSTATCSGSVP
jgi:hypothetical protein